MLLRFPTLDALRLALTTAVIPVEHARGQVAYALAEDGAIWTDSADDLARGAVKELKKWGVEARRGPGELRDQFELAVCWLQLVPLVKEAEILCGEKTPILFELRRGEELPGLAAEMLRLGNDRQSFRHIQADGDSRTLLRVIGPPYYSLLRTLGDLADKPAAFYEQAPRVWVQLGHKHPLGSQVQPAAGQMLLLRPPRIWESLAEGAFRDIYQQLEFKLPAADVPWVEQELASRITVPLQLSTASSTDDAELWVLHEDPQRQVEDLVRHADDQLISRLSFAVGKIDDRTVVVLRVRPSKLPPPVLVLRGQAYHPYLKLQNLFVPVGRRLYPPLRRDVVGRLLAADPSRIVWLEPGEGKTFTPESLPDNGFRPLSQWVEYVLDREHEALSAWSAAHTFEFEPYVCNEDPPLVPREPPEKRAERQPAKSQPKATSGKVQPGSNRDDFVIGEVVDETAPKGSFEPQTAAPQPAALQKELREIEGQFIELTEPLDAPMRRDLWRQMGRLNAALEHRQDASLCWASAIWEERSPPITSVRDWVASEHGDRPHDLLSWPKLAAAARDKASQPVLASHLCATLAWHAAADEPPPHLPGSIGHAAQLLEKNESHLPVRVAWLGWVSLAELSGNDSLLLARARDRMLERLFQHGLTAELDMPGFLRSRGSGDTDRYRILRQRLIHLRDTVAGWIIEPPGATARTRAYSDLMFAYALSRIGETTACERILEWTRRQLTAKDELHAWVRDAFELRIKEARQGGALPTGLGPDLLRRLEGMERTTRYKADRLRQHSRILEPFERIDPYRRWHRRYSDELSRDLALLMDIQDRDELRTRITQLTRAFAASPKFAPQRLRVLTAALELGPRLGEAFAVQLLDQVMPLLSAADDIVSRAMLLEKALLVAAHFDQPDAVQAFVDKFEQSLDEIFGHYLSLQIDHQPENKEKLVAIESLFNQSLRGLRKLGMRDAISRIFARIVELVREKSAKRPAKRLPLRGDEATRASMLLLCVAGGWFYFGQKEQAAEVTGQVRRQLFDDELPPIQRTNLACAYVSAIGQASIEMALPMIEELFQARGDGGGQNLAGVKDQQTTATHFSLSQLDVVEATVLALASDEASLSPESRRWLDEDEFLVRRRIHQNVREMTG